MLERTRAKKSSRSAGMWIPKHWRWQTRVTHANQCLCVLILTDGFYDNMDKDDVSDVNAEGHM